MKGTLSALWSLQQRLTWWIICRVFHVRYIDGMKFVDIRGSMDDGHEICERLKEGLAYVQDAGADFSELVAHEIAAVAATARKEEKVSPAIRAYSSPFTGPERTNSFFLACRLVWSAAYLRALRESREAGIAAGEEALLAASSGAEQAFIRRFPEAYEWLEYCGY